MQPQATESLMGTFDMVVYKTKFCSNEAYV